MTIEAVIFDLGGVLVRTEDRQPRAALAARLGMSYQELDDLVFLSPTGYEATLGKLSTLDHWRSVLASLGLEESKLQEVQAGFWGGDRLDRELIDLLRSLRGRYRTALLSNAWDDLRQVLTERWGISDAFDELIISAEVGLAKPDPRIYHLTAQRLRVEPQQAVFVDDMPRNVQAAREQGMHAIQFVDSAQTRRDLAALLNGGE
jgi:HAD superfamily hydrolase (TIGR01509 family)